jgi:hypothetical protein
MTSRQLVLAGLLLLSPAYAAAQQPIEIGEQFTIHSNALNE